LNQGRRTRYYNFQDNAEKNFRKHAIRFGGQLQFQEVDAYNEGGIVPTFNLGVNNNTPQFLAANFQGGISQAQLGTANGLLALLGGIVSSGSASFNVESRTSGFKPVQRFQDFRYGNHSLYVQDQWRASQSLTLNLGLRYELFTGLKLNNGLSLEPVIAKGADAVAAVLNPNGTYDFLGANTGVEGQYYNTDKNNFAPILSAAWTPPVKGRLAEWLLGKGGKTVLRGGYRMSYLNDQMITALNNAANGNVGLGTTGVSALNPTTGTTLLNSRLNNLPGITPPSVVVPRTFAQNNGAAFGFFGTVFGIDPNIQTPKVHEYNFGIQREFGANAVEIRYVGGRSDNLWRSIDYNQVDITSNGFAADFNRALNNIRLTNNPACTTAQNAGCQALTVFPNLGSGGLLTNATIRNSILNGTPADLAITYIQNALTGTVKFLPNPNTGIANLFTNGANYRYNSLQAEFRRRFTKGLYAQVNYTFQKTLGTGVGTSQTLVEPFLDNARPQLEYSRADFDQAHVFKANGVWELPVGRNHRFLSGANRVVDAIIGGRQFSPIITVSSGAPISIIDTRGTFNRSGRSGRQTANSSLSKDEIKDLFKVRVAPDGVFYVPANIVSSTGRASEGYGSTPFSGQVFTNIEPGQTGTLERAFLNGPWRFNVDATLAKNFRLWEGARFQLRLEGFNVMNRANFFVGQFQNINSAQFGRITSTFGSRVVQIGGRLDF
ncbi:MAG: TonB-dependent receptor, partial [Blastocatellia bacterium]|nr:TonB-dependent receptor [Blastocatellia bacterium]